MGSKDGRLIINWMFPDVLDLYGDRGNIMALERLGRRLGFDVVIRRVESFSAAGEADFSVFCSGDLDVVSSLARDKSGIENLLAGSKKILVFGTTGALFGGETVRLSRPGFCGLGLLDAEIKERPAYLVNFKYPAGNDYLLELDAEYAKEGFDCASGVYLKSVTVNAAPEVKPFAKVLFGLDNTGELEHAGFDGAVFGNVIWTNLLGPALVKNPWLTLSLIEKVTGKHFPIDEEMREFWEFELKSLHEFKEFIKKKI